VRLEGSGKLKKSSALIRNQTRELRIVAQSLNQLHYRGQVITKVIYVPEFINIYET
jgi:hypothetical protein